MIADTSPGDWWDAAGLSGITVSFTAARELDERGEEVVINVLTQLHADRYVTGACTGGDAFIGRWLARNRPDAEHVVVVPAGKGWIDPWWSSEPPGRVTVIPMPPGTTYKDRNAELVRRGTAVCGFPAFEEDHKWSRRSGTWQTIRMSRRAGNLARWDCVQPPYRGEVLMWPGEFAVPGL